MLKENKFFKYLLYAIGEIILVVIGILIALNVNNNSELEKSEQKINKIFIQIQSELKTDLESADGYLKNRNYNDSLIQMVKDGKVTYEMYNNDKRLLTLINFYRAVIVHDNGYQALMRNIDNLPEKYDTLIPLLNNIYDYDKDRVDKYNAVMASFNERMHERWAKDYEWFSEPKDVVNIDERIQFYLNDPRYINDVRLYSMYAKNNQKMFILRFKNDAEKALDVINAYNLK